MEKPFLFRFARKCCSPARVDKRPDYYYDDSSDLVRFMGISNHPPAIDLSGQQGPKTKKCDIEKGDDNKDRRMWQ